VGHKNALRLAFLDDAHAQQALVIQRIAGSDGAQEAGIDLANDLQVAEQDVS